MPLGTYHTASGRRLSQTLKEYGEKAFDALGKALYREARGILTMSQGLVPVDTGTLRSSGYVTEPARVGNTITVDVGYGGPAAQINPKTGESSASYAIYVHENLEAHHPVGMAKYLEIPFNMATRGMASRIADFIDQEMASGSEMPDIDYGDVIY